jgi:succinyl-CoA synthetase beta subunit
MSRALHGVGDLFTALRRQGLIAIGQLMQTVPELTEIDVNPLMVHAKGQGVTALDALIVV